MHGLLLGPSIYILKTLWIEVIWYFRIATCGALSVKRAGDFGV